MANATEGFRLGIDFGTSHTTAILRWPDGHARPILFEGSPLLPSSVYAEPNGSLLVGRDAIHAARMDPARFEPTPKRRITAEDTTVRLGDQEVSAVDMVAAVLRRVADEAVRVSGQPAGDLSVTLTHPAGWDTGRIKTLEDASRKAGLPQPTLVPEPVAAAGYFVAVLGRTIPAGSALVVYDFGGGTFDASVVTPTPGAHNGYAVLAMGGLDNLGGVDLDAALLKHVASKYHDTDPAAWQRLEEPQTPADRRHRRHLAEDVRAAKEMLSRAASATVPVPLLELEARVTREEFDTLARPLLERTVGTTADAIASAKANVAAILLVGGSSRIPLVADLLRQHIGLSPSTIDQPETVVAEGSIRLASGGSGLTRAAAAVPIVPVVNGPMSRPADPWADSEDTPVLLQHAVPRQAPPVPAAPTQLAQPRVPYHDQVLPRPYSGRRKRRWPVVLGAALAVAVVAAGTWYGIPYIVGEGGEGGSGTSSTPAETTKTTAATPYVRAERPAWLPADWQKIIDDEQEASVVTPDASNGGKCQYGNPGVVHVTRDEFGVSGCNTTPLTKTFTLTDGAIEAEYTVAAGCGGMWMRTTNKGYFVAVCADGNVRLHELYDPPPGEENAIGGPWTGFDKTKVVVGLLAQGSNLTVYIDGAKQATIVNGNIATGRVGVGGFAPEKKIDATIIRFRAWSPAG